ncbi:uncharacterized protein [Polyergus mexicanus]
MKKRQQKKKEQEIEVERLRQEKQERKQILTELNKLNEKFSILEKNLSEYREKKHQLLKELNVTNNILKQAEIAKIQKMNNNRNTVIKENPTVKNRESHHKIALQNKIIDAPPLSAPIVQTPLMTIGADNVSPTIFQSKTHINKELPSMLNCEAQLKTNLYAPKQHSLFTLGIMSDDPNHKHAFLPYKKSSKLKKSTPRNFKSQNKRKTSNYLTNLHLSKENKDINKQIICDDNFAGVKQLNQDIDIRRSGIPFYYSHLSSAQLQLNPSSVSSYPYSPYLPDISANFNLPVPSIYVTSNINPNFVSPLTCANQSPLFSPVTRVDIPHMNPPTCLPPIYTNMSHVNLFSSLTPATSIND